MTKNFLIFDLDNTLYSTDIGFFKLIDRNISNYMKEKLHIREDLIEEKRIKYFKKFGTTLKGLQIFYEIEPDDFLQYVHNVDVSMFLKKDERLIQILKRLNYKKVIFSNSNREYIERVLNVLGVIDFFDFIIDIKELNYIPKPHLEAYKILQEKLKIENFQGAIIDDMIRNLKPAKELGFKTVWLRNSAEGREGLTNVTINSIEDGKISLISNCGDHFKPDFVINNILDIENIEKAIWNTL